MKPSDFWLAAIAVILTLILIRLSALAKHVRAHVLAQKEVGGGSPAPLEAASK
jgi:hypothetical protein